MCVGDRCLKRERVGHVEESLFVDQLSQLVLDPDRLREAQQGHAQLAVGRVRQLGEYQLQEGDLLAEEQRPTASTSRRRPPPGREQEAAAASTTVNRRRVE